MIILDIENLTSQVPMYVLLNLLKKSLGKEIKCKACQAFYCFFAVSWINSMIQKHES